MFTRPTSFIYTLFVLLLTLLSLSASTLAAPMPIVPAAAGVAVVARAPAPASLMGHVFHAQARGASPAPVPQVANFDAEPLKRAERFMLRMDRRRAMSESA